MTPQFASKESSQKFFENKEIDPSKIRTIDEVSISSIGMGTHLGKPDDATDAEYESTLIQACLLGINLFDTARNYRMMRSEKMLSRVIQSLEDKLISREELFIISKAGIIPFEGDSFEEYVCSHFLNPGIIKVEDVALDSHCIAPKFLDHQIEESLKTLDLDCLDLYCLQNPEIQLQAHPIDEVYNRITKAFELFEQKVAENKIRRYGITSWNGFRKKKEGFSVEKILECAKAAGGRRASLSHHTAAIKPHYVRSFKIGSSAKVRRAKPSYHGLGASYARKSFYAS